MLELATDGIANVSTAQHTASAQDERGGCYPRHRVPLAAPHVHVSIGHGIAGACVQTEPLTCTPLAFEQVWPALATPAVLRKGSAWEQHPRGQGPAPAARHDKERCYLRGDWQRPGRGRSLLSTRHRSQRGGQEGGLRRPRQGTRWKSARDSVGAGSTRRWVSACDVADTTREGSRNLLGLALPLVSTALFLRLARNRGEPEMRCQFLAAHCQLTVSD